MSQTVTRNVTCTRCGCVCDDITLHSDSERILSCESACDLGESWFLNHPVDRTRPAALADGVAVDVETAIETAADYLSRADLPLIYGMGTVTCEAQREAMFLAEEAGGVIDSHTSLTHGPTKIGVQLVGKVACTLGEVRNRADLVVCWGINPAESHPRLLTRYALAPKGKYTPNGRSDRRLIVVDVRETPTQLDADSVLLIRPGKDFEIITALRALLKGQAIDAEVLASSGVTVEQLQDLLGRMKQARFGVILFGQGLTATRGKHANAAAILALTAELNDVTKFTIIPVRDHGNETGADMVFGWITGYPFGVSYSRGYPRSNPGEFTCVDLLARGEVDAALIVGADPGATMPRDVADHLTRIPTIVLDHRVTKTSRLARVHITTATTGISAPGTAYRMDRVPLVLRPPLKSPYPTDEEVVRRIRQSVARKTAALRVTGHG